MTTIDTSRPADHGHDDHGHHGSYLKSRGSIWADIINWATTVDHKKIGVMYLVAVLFFFFCGGLMAILLRTDLLDPIRDTATGVTGGSSFLVFNKPESIGAAGQNYNRIMTLHGAIMVFMFIVPGIPASLGNFFLPLMIGAKDVAFPKLNLFSWYVYLFGALFALWSVGMGGVETGWTFYTPYSSSEAVDHANVVLVVLGVFIMGFSSIMTGLNFVVTVHKLRAPGMGWFDMPLFVWAVYATALIQVLATPVIGITTLLLIFERVFGIGIFDPALGGDPVLFQHFFWFYSHPVVYIMILPAMGVISECIAVHARKPIFGYHAIAFSSLAIAGVAFLVWGHHLFTSEGELAAVVFSALTFLVAIPTAVKVFNWVSTLYKGSIALNTAMLYALAFIFTFSVGGLTGLPLATLATDLHLHDTYYVVAHFHYVMFGGMVIGMMAGLHHWWPKMFGKMVSEPISITGFALVFIGFNLTFIIQFILGVNGMPRRYASYIDEFRQMHQFSTIGSWILALGFLIHLFAFLHSMFKGKPAPANPWGGLTLEWEADAPPDEHNFAHEPLVTHGPYDFDDVVPPHCDPADFPLPEPLPAGAKGHH
ncbi:MAG: cbb3-type cytochrome c oxidase subunit I [Phycisphaeraceae bacterium]|nr:cbb3-type cytochrome c oxidase subunit I [Phycisphaerales bacterium]MCB9859168.1 cbb3-type cytochrome c oxidase subunit I [Phycisphaeraceae bacterium]